MNDQQFLMWIHDRLMYVHGEKELYDYMWRLRSIISKTDGETRDYMASDNYADDLRARVNATRPKARRRSWLSRWDWRA